MSIISTSWPGRIHKVEPSGEIEVIVKEEDILDRF